MDHAASATPAGYLYEVVRFDLHSSLAWTSYMPKCQLVPKHGGDFGHDTLPG